MKFLLTNDDGIASPALAAIVDVMKEYGEVFVVCPDKDMSAVGHSITFREPLRVLETTVFGRNVKAWTVSGTPADCVKIALDVLVPGEIDFVVSGMNIGSNIGRDSYYSGTIAGAREASFFGIPAVAVSLDVNTVISDFSEAKKLFNNVIEIILGQQYASNLLLNINIPNVVESQCKGVTFAELDFSVKRYKHLGEIDVDGNEVYWLTGQPSQLTFDELEGDFSLLHENYITVTPLESQVTDLGSKREIEHWFNVTRQKSPAPL